MPDAIGGQWRFAWELGWRNAGDLVAGLPAGNYPVDFRSVSNYLAVPSLLTVAVTNNGLTLFTNEYYPTLPPENPSDTGTLTVNITPNAPAGSGWRIFGESAWRAPGSSAAGLLPDTYAIEFEPVSGWSRPASRGVRVFGGQGSLVAANYVLAASLPNGVSVPNPILPASFITAYADYPYGFNGQLQTDVGYGSGVAVRETVVLTAAHMVFNDQTLAYVSKAWWSFQQEAGVFQPEPLAARGWYILSGYAAQRTNDLQVGGYGIDQSSAPSRELDVAAMYFTTLAARGGYGGYLASDIQPNPYLTGSSNKMVVGYPVDGSVFGQVLQANTMYATVPQRAAFTPATNDTYMASWFLSYPGNSGGPVYAQFNGYYYPAAVYLGTLGSGQNSVSVVRAINSDVVNLINLASSQGDSGTNYTGGGVITWIGQGDPLSPPNLQANLGPAAAVSAGARWHFLGQSNYVASGSYIQSASLTPTVEFKKIVGWQEPTNTRVSLALGGIY